MSSTYTPTPTLFVDITIPSDGDPETAASVNGPFQELADGLALLSLPATSGGNRYPVGATSAPRMQATTSIGTPAEWSQIAFTDAWVAVGATPVQRVIPLKFPIGCSMTDILVYVKAGGGHGALPAGGDRPSISLYEYDPTDESNTLIAGPVTDPTTAISIAAYEAPHAIPISASPGTFFPDVVLKKYFVTLTTEGGANAEVGFRYNGVATSVDIDSVDPGGA